MNQGMILRIDTLGGQCPVQAEGFVGDAPFYFRARGSRWSMSIGGADVVGKPDFHHEEPYGSGPFDAGHMSVDEARAFLEGAARLYAAERGAAIVIAEDRGPDGTLEVP